MAQILSNRYVGVQIVLQVMSRSDRSRSPTAPRPIKSVAEMVRLFNRHCADSSHDPVRLSFLVRDWEGMDGEFVARLTGDNENSPPHTQNLRFYTPDGSQYCSADVSTHVCKKQQWLLDGRPVHFRIKSFGTYIDSTVNPRNGHLTGCACGDCLGAEQMLGGRT